MKSLLFTAAFLLVVSFSSAQALNEAPREDYFVTYQFDLEEGELYKVLALVEKIGTGTADDRSAPIPLRVIVTGPEGVSVMDVAGRSKISTTPFKATTTGRHTVLVSSLTAFEAVARVALSKAAGEPIRAALD